MTAGSERPGAFLAARPRVVLARVVTADGSTPREAGAWMLVGPHDIFGTIGGGRMEFMAIEAARRMIAGDEAAHVLDIPLGPGIGQCCGGRVAIDLRVASEAERIGILREAEAERQALPSVLVFGAGHVGRALAAALALLPVKAIVVETRADALSDLPGGIEGRLSALPEREARDAPAGSAFVVMTHDHALDFLIAGEALRRADAAYVGLIGSATKRELFARWWRDEAGGAPAELDRLRLPIGGTTRDKRPAVIAALAAAEIMAKFMGPDEPAG